MSSRHEYLWIALLAVGGCIKAEPEPDPSGESTVGDPGGFERAGARRRSHRSRSMRESPTAPRTRVSSPVCRERRYLRRRRSVLPRAVRRQTAGHAPRVTASTTISRSIRRSSRPCQRPTRCSWPSSTRNLANLEKPPQMHQFGLILDERGQLLDLRAAERAAHAVALDERDPAAGIAEPAPRIAPDGVVTAHPTAGALRDFMTGAIRQHYTKTLGARFPARTSCFATDSELDPLDRFMRRTGRLNELLLANVAMTEQHAQSPGARSSCRSDATAATPTPAQNVARANLQPEHRCRVWRAIPRLASFPIDGGFRHPPQPERFVRATERSTSRR